MENQCKNTDIIFLDGVFKSIGGSCVSKMSSDSLSLSTNLTEGQMEYNIQCRYLFINADNNVHYAAINFGILICHFCGCCICIDRNAAQTGLFGNVGQHKSEHRKDGESAIC